MLNRLRGRIRVQADGQMKTGRDVVIGALLGADEFGFATAPLVVEGCIMMRKCHLNTCPVGVATQDPVLRKFASKPEHVVNFFFFVAEEARQIMAQLGIRTFDEADRPRRPARHEKGHRPLEGRGLDFSRVFHQARGAADVPRYQRRHAGPWPRQALDVKPHRSAPRPSSAAKVQFMDDARNVNRRSAPCSPGELIRHPRRPARPHHLHPDGGTGGQSFGAFLANGITLYLIGDANDYTGKGLSGGRVVVRPSIDFRGDATKNIIVGNTALYGATSGEAFFRGVAGERFAVRLSGHRGGGRHRRPRLRIHDRRHGGGAGQDRPQLRRRHVERRGLHLRRGRPVRQTLQHLDGRRSTRCAAARPSRAGAWARWHPRTDEALLKKLIETTTLDRQLRARDPDHWAGRWCKFVKVFPARGVQACAGRARRPPKAIAGGAWRQTRPVNCSGQPT